MKDKDERRGKEACRRFKKKKFQPCHKFSALFCQGWLKGFFPTVNFNYWISMEKGMQEENRKVRVKGRWVWDFKA